MYKLRTSVRLTKLQLYLNRFHADKGRLPGDFPELYGHLNIEPVVDPVTGKEFPLFDIARNGGEWRMYLKAPGRRPGG